MRYGSLALTVALACASGCGSGRTYTLTGQVIAIDSARREITIRHRDIPGFMSAMTMPFKVQNPALLEGRQAGDLITATLVVSKTESHLSSIVSTGHAPLPDAGFPVFSTGKLEPGGAVEDADFTDQFGRHQRLSDWRGKTLAITFIYTRCPLPDFCPRMNKQFAALQTEVESEPALKQRVHLFSITLDPDFDTPPVLAAHASRAAADSAVWTFLTGTTSAVDRFAAQFGVYVVREGNDAAGVTHNLRTVLVGADGRLLKIAAGADWNPAELVEVIRNQQR